MRAKRRATRGGATRVLPIPRGDHTVTSHLTVRGAAEAIDFYQRAFGARERGCLPGLDAKVVMHAELQIGSSIVFLAHEFSDMGCRAPQTLGGTTGTLHIDVRDVDRVLQRAGAAGAGVRMPATDMLWGDRDARVADPFGHARGLATYREDVSGREIERRAQAFFAEMGAGS